MESYVQALPIYVKYRSLSRSVPSKTVCFYGRSMGAPAAWLLPFKLVQYQYRMYVLHDGRSVVDVR